MQQPGFMYDSGGGFGNQFSFNQGSQFNSQSPSGGFSWDDPLGTTDGSGKEKTGFGKFLSGLGNWAESNSGSLLDIAGGFFNNLFSSKSPDINIDLPWEKGPNTGGGSTNNNTGGNGGYNPPPEDRSSNWVLPAVIGGAAFLIIIVLIIVLVMKKK